MSNEVFDIIIGNLIFWPIYVYVALIPYTMFQKVINQK